MRAVGWKTKSNINDDLNYQSMMQRQIDKAKKYCPKGQVSNLVDIPSLKTKGKDSLFN